MKPLWSKPHLSVQNVSATLDFKAINSSLSVQMFGHIMYTLIKFIFKQLAASVETYCSVVAALLALVQYAADPCGGQHEIPTSRVGSRLNEMTMIAQNTAQKTVDSNLTMDGNFCFTP